MEVENENKNCIIKHKEGSAELIPVDVSKMMKKTVINIRKPSLLIIFLFA